ncbi:PocR ligand-binding domain-containing protein [Vibrio sp. TH_r3]|uniref:PocR ligand-binding domain-containing protein n=1 Tax=Vibrio sp. TH_r3 TaxID=3082084 RepID=UPI00295536B0|nr:PocR ligand-binding domain-containing protein [Vibrio sp. TH_r3]MDV7103688.1 PocR ligand-binding domain-containing protein [Vibrio sp. TH_r3]
MKSDSFLESQGINKILEDFANATGLAVVLVDIEGREVSASFNFTDFCLKIRQNPDLHERCKSSDRCGGLEASKENKPCVYRCHAGLIDFSIPLEINGHLVGFVLCGQARVKNANDLGDIQPVDKKWMRNAELVGDYEKIPVIDYAKLFSAADLLKVLVDDSVKKHMDFVVINDNYDIKSLFHSRDSRHSYDGKIKKAVRYIETHYFEEIRLEEVADHVFLSPHYFSKLFKKEIGVGFNHYVNQQRLQGAKKMLQYSDWSISRIAHNLGYSCSSYFCKVFRNSYGMTPQDFRNSISEEHENKVN